MTDIAQRISHLSPEKRELLLRRLNQQDIKKREAIHPRSRATHAFPLSFSQERLWIVDQFAPANHAYNISGGMRLKGKLDLAALKQTLDEIVARHESLRTNFTTIDDRPAQIIAPPQPLPLSCTDLSDLPADERDAAVERLMEVESRRSFDLSADLLIRTTLLKLSPEEHIFLLTMHHIVSDGWSLGIFVREFAALYQAFVANKPNPLPALPIQYADFACWQREWLQGQVLDNQLRYWKQQLGGELPTLDLMLEKPRPSIQTFNSGAEARRLPLALAQLLGKLSKREGATLFMTLLAAFKLLLSRYTGLEDIVVGVPVSGRNRAEVEHLIGFFINSLVLRTDLSGDISFRELLGRIRTVATDAYAHQDVPFERLLIELQPERNLSHTPLFQVFFNMLYRDRNQIELPGLTMEPLVTPDIGSKFDLTLYVVEDKETIDLSLVYNSDLYTPARAAEILTQYEHLLTQIVANPDEKVAHYSLVTPAAAGHLPDPVAPLDTTWSGAVHTQFSQKAQQYPDRPALTATHESWTYQQLEILSNQLAQFLLDQGLQRQGVVAIYAHRSATLVWAMLGILKAGGAFLVLDPAYPPERLRSYVEAAKPGGWLQLAAAGPLPDELEALVSTLPGNCRLTLPETLAEADSLLAGCSPDDPTLSVQPDDLAYVAFTSGSTGAPKGILGNHLPLAHFVQWHSQTFGLNETDRFSMLGGLAHDPLLRDIFTPLCLGATLCIPDQENILAPGQLSAWMMRQAISVCHLTPAVGQLIAQESDQPIVLEALRYAFFGGDVLTNRHVTMLCALAPNVQCVNFYGTTETPQAMAYLVVPDPAKQMGNDSSTGMAAHKVPIGRGIEGVQLLVLNRAQQLAGIGEVGEIYVRTPYLARGYLDDQALTEKRFITNPFTHNAGDRLYRTGDLGRYLPDGRIEFFGRNDNQVKIRGFRIELGEIETVLNDHPLVQKAVVSPWTTEAGGTQLAAYVVPAPLKLPTSSDLRSFLQNRLPDYMIPATFTVIDALPLTPNGKINYRALPKPNLRQESRFVAPQTHVEVSLANIWTDVLGVERIGRHGNFFELGGHSLLATQVVSRVRKQFKVELPLRNLFMTPTVAEVADVVETLLWTIQGQAASPDTLEEEHEEMEL